MPDDLAPLPTRQLWLGNEYCQTLLPTQAHLTSVLSSVLDSERDSTRESDTLSAASGGMEGMLRSPSAGLEAASRDVDDRSRGKGLDEALASMTAAGPSRGLTLVLPPLTDDGLQRLQPVLTLLERRFPSAEVVVNDWGALRVVGQTGLQPVLGRLLTRILRDPRLPPTLLPVPQNDAATRDSAQDSSSPYAQLLSANRIRWIEVDYVPQAAQIPYAALGVRPILTLPHVFVATGRVCPFAGLKQPREVKFSVPPSCRQECRRYSAELVDPAAPASRLPLLSFGNTIFSQLEPAQLKAAVQWAAAHKARVVLRNRPFDELGLEASDAQEALGWLETHGHLNPGEPV